MIENLKRVQMYLIVDDIKNFLDFVPSHLFSYSRMRLQDSWLVHLCIHIFLFFGSNFVFVLYENNKKENR